MMILLVDNDVVGLAQSMVMPDHATDLLTLLTDLTKEKNLISVDIDEASMIKLDIKINEGRVDRGTTSRSRERTETRDFLRIPSASPLSVVRSLLV